MNPNDVDNSDFSQKDIINQLLLLTSLLLEFEAMSSVQGRAVPILDEEDNKLLFNFVHGKLTSDEIKVAFDRIRAKPYLVEILADLVNNYQDEAKVNSHKNCRRP